MNVLKEKGVDMENSGSFYGATRRNRGQRTASIYSEVNVAKSVISSVAEAGQKLVMDNELYPDQVMCYVPLCQTQEMVDIDYSEEIDEIDNNNSANNNGAKDIFDNLEPGTFTPIPDFILRQMIQKSAHHANISSTKSILNSLKDHVSFPSFFKPPSHGVAFRDVFVNVSDKNLKAVTHSHENISLVSWPFFYHESGDKINSKSRYDASDNNDDIDNTLCPEWTKFLESLLGQDGLLYFQEFLGLAILRRMSDFGARALVLHGPGMASLAPVLKVVAQMFPDWALSSIPPNEWKWNRLNPLKKVMLNLVIDMPVSKINDPSLVGNVIRGFLVGGPRAAHLLVCERFPDVPDASNAFWRSFMFLKTQRPPISSSQVPNFGLPLKPGQLVEANS